MKNTPQKFCTLITAALLFTTTLFATQRKVLFIGNSYTFTNTMPAMLQAFAAAKGDTLIFSQSDPGGYTFGEHCVYAPTISLIFSQPWDVVVLQEQSQLPAFPPDQVDTQVYPYAHILDSMIHANDTCTQTMFLMTWGHADGDPSNCPGYPAICTYAGMQLRLRQSYLQMTQDNHAVVAPVGAAWKVERDSFPTLWMYQSDSDHPVIAGSYLETCVLYSSIFHKAATGCTYVDGLAAADARTLQYVSDKVTMDSMYQWQQYGHYPDAAFTCSTAGSTTTFTNTEPILSSHYWSFGDAAIDTAANPVHNYAGSGTFIVAHTVSNDCFTEIQRDTLHIGATGLTTAIKGNAYPIYVQQEAGGYVNFVLPADNIYNTLDVYDANGRSAGKFVLNGANVTEHFAPGLYLYRAFSKEKNIVFTGKLVVY